MGRLCRIAAGIVAIAIFLLGATCEPVTLPTAQVVGEDADNVFYLGPYPSVGFPGSYASLYRMNLADGQPEVLENDLSPDLVVAGEYLAWSDASSHAVQVKNLTTGDQKQYLAGMADTEDAYVNVIDIDAGRMLVRYPSSAGWGERFKLFDLASGGERDLQLLDPLDWYESFYSADLDGNYLAYFASPLDDTEPLWLELAVRLELVDLGSDEHTVVVRGMRVGEGPFVANGLVVWSDLKDGGMRSRVRAYDLAAKKTRTLVENLDSETDTAYLEDFDGTYLLVLRQQTIQFAEVLNFLAGPTTLDLVSLDGQARTIATVNAAQFDLPFDQARLIRHYVVWPDYHTNELAVYDIDTGFTNRYAFFPD